MGEVINLVNDFKVDNVIFNCGEYNDLENELINVLDKKHIEYYSCIKELNIDEYKLQFLNTVEYDNENDNSSVILIIDKTLKGKKILTHPNINTATVSIRYDDLIKFIKYCNNTYYEV